TFLILKNCTNEPQEAHIILHHDRGKKKYDFKLPKIDAQQVGIVDIKQLRDDKVQDKNGQTLPADAQFGGAVVFSQAGAFVISDPTFILGPEKSPRFGIGGYSCVNTDHTPVCDAASNDVRDLAFYLESLNRELQKSTPDPGQIELKKELVRLQVEKIIAR